MSELGRFGVAETFRRIIRTDADGRETIEYEAFQDTRTPLSPVSVIARAAAGRTVHSSDLKLEGYSRDDLHRMILAHSHYNEAVDVSFRDAAALARIGARLLELNEHKDQLVLPPLSGDEKRSIGYLIDLVNEDTAVLEAVSQPLEAELSHPRFDPACVILAA